MSHHSEELTPEMHKLAESLCLGPTKSFPMGKLNATDEGQIQLAVGHESGKVVLNFGKPIAWIGLNREEALSLANSLIQHAAAIGS